MSSKMRSQETCAPKYLVSNLQDRFFATARSHRSYEIVERVNSYSYIEIEIQFDCWGEFSCCSHARRSLPKEKKNSSLFGNY